MKVIKLVVLVGMLAVFSGCATVLEEAQKQSEFEMRRSASDLGRLIAQ